MPLPIIRRIEQEHCTGCAVACVATVAGVSYKQAVKAAFGKPVVRHGLELTFNDMARTLRKLGLSCRMGTDFRQRKLPAITMFEWWSTGDRTTASSGTPPSAAGSSIPATATWATTSTGTTGNASAARPSSSPASAGKGENT